jgi:hypothetical protein
MAEGTILEQLRRDLVLACRLLCHEEVVVLAYKAIACGYSREGSLSDRASITACEGKTDSPDGKVGSMTIEGGGVGDSYLSGKR